GLNAGTGAGRAGRRSVRIRARPFAFVPLSAHARARDHPPMRRLAAIAAAFFLLPAAHAFGASGPMVMTGDAGGGASADSVTITQTAANPTLTVNAAANFAVS